MNSYRGTWQTAPVYVPTSLSANVEISKVTAEDFKKYITEIVTTFNKTEADAITELIISKIETMFANLTDNVIDDSPWGEIKPVPLDLLFNIKRLRK